MSDTEGASDAATGGVNAVLTLNGLLITAGTVLTSMVGGQAGASLATITVGVGLATSLVLCLFSLLFATSASREGRSYAVPFLRAALLCDVLVIPFATAAFLAAL